MTSPVRKIGYLNKDDITTDMILAGDGVLAEATMLNPNRVKTYAVYAKFFAKENLVNESNKNILNKLFREYYDNYYKESLINGFDDDIIFHSLMGLVVDYRLIKHYYGSNKIDTLDKMFKDKKDTLDAEKIIIVPITKSNIVTTSNHLSTYLSTFMLITPIVTTIITCY